MKNNQPNKTSYLGAINHFKFQPERIINGTLYYYVKSNQDGSDPIEVYIYISDQTNIQVLKVEPSATSALVIATMDWEIFTAVTLDSRFMMTDGSRPPQAFSTLNQKTGVLTTTVGDMRNKIVIPFYPFHNYNFDFTSLNIAFRHLINPESDFTIGIIEPNWEKVIQYRQARQPLTGELDDMMLYRGETSIIYIGDEYCHEQLCRHYKLIGPGLLNQEGFVWVNKEYGHFERFTHPHRDNPRWNSFLLDLREISHLSASDWETFISNNI